MEIILVLPARMPVYLIAGHFHAPRIMLTHLFAVALLLCCALTVPSTLLPMFLHSRLSFHPVALSPLYACRDAYARVRCTAIHSCFARAGRMDGADSCRFQRSRGLRAAAAGCRRRQNGQGECACKSVSRVCGLARIVRKMHFCSVSLNVDVDFSDRVIWSLFL